MKKISQIRTGDLKDNYRRIFNTDDGKVILEHLKVCFGFYQTTYAKGDPYDTAFFEGQRSVVLNIIRMMQPQEKLEHQKEISNE